MSDPTTEHRTGSRVQRMLRRVDDFQQRRAWLAFPFAVFKKFGEDRGGNLAALIAYYGFFSLFPLLLVLVTVLGMVLRGNPELQGRVLDTALGQFPVIGRQIQVGTLPSSGVALTVGIVGTLWAGLGITQVFQEAMNDVWDVPIRFRPNFIEKRIRGLLLLVVLGAFAVASTLVAGIGTAPDTLGVFRVLGILGSFLLNVSLFLLAFRILTDRPLSWGEIAPGAAVAGFFWTVLNAMGSFYVTRQVTGAQEVYGTFALVLGLLVWMYLGAQLTILAAEVNVVRVRRLWPRSLQQPPLEGADESALRSAARVEERVEGQRVDVTFEESDRPQAAEG